MNEELRQSIRDYFAQPGFERFLKQLRRAYESSTAGARGSVRLSRITAEERATLDRFYGIYSPPAPGETKSYSIRKFERLLQGSRFGLSIPELLEALSGERVLTRAERQAVRDTEWEQAIRNAVEWGANGVLTNPIGEAAGEASVRLIQWLDGLRDETSPGSRTLRRLFAKSARDAEECLSLCLTALRFVMEHDGGSSGRLVRLPVLAARATGDAHALDWKYPLGRLFWWGLTSVYGRPGAQQVDSDDLDRENDDTDSIDDEAREAELDMMLSHAIKIREGYRLGGVADDDLSSQAMLYAPNLFGLYEERILTLRQVERLISNLPITLDLKSIFMVENPSVFAELIDADIRRSLERDSKHSPIIMCGNGQPTVAVIKLLDGLLASFPGAKLYYSGDLDPAGLGIAHSLHMRCGGVLAPWRMDRQTYLRHAQKGIPLTDAEIQRLRLTSFDWAPGLTLSMADRGVKLHQELWVEELVRDLAVAVL